MDYRAALICGIDIPIPECQLIAHQPSIEEIAFVGETDFFIGIQTICLHKSMFIEDKTLLDDITNFQIFMTIMTDKEAKNKRDKVLSILKLVFPSYKVLVTPSSLIFKKDEENILIDENNFEPLQAALRLIFCMKDGPMTQSSFNPANDKAKEIAQKLMRGRERVSKQNGSANASIFSQYISILTIGLQSMSMLELKKLTVFQLYDLIERYSLYINWDLDIRQRLAGGKPENPPDNWMKNIHN